MRLLKHIDLLDSIAGGLLLEREAFRKRVLIAFSPVQSDGSSRYRKTTEPCLQQLEFPIQYSIQFNTMSMHFIALIWSGFD